MNDKKRKMMYILEMVSSFFGLVSAIGVALATYIIAKKNKDEKNGRLSYVMAIAVIVVTYFLMALISRAWLKYLVSVIIVFGCNFLFVRIQKRILE